MKESTIVACAGIFVLAPRPSSGQAADKALDNVAKTCREAKGSGHDVEASILDSGGTVLRRSSFHTLGASVFLAAAVVLGLGSSSRADDREEARAHFEAAKLAIGQGEWKLAEGELQKAIAQDPVNGLLHLNLAIVQDTLQNPDAALASLQLATALGLPPEQKEQAAALKARLYFSREKLKRDDAQRREELKRANGPLEWLAGNWTSYCSYTVGRSLVQFNSTLQLAPGGRGLAGTLNSVAKASVYNAYNQDYADGATNRQFRLDVWTNVVGSFEFSINSVSCVGKCGYAPLNRRPDEGYDKYSSSSVGITRLADDEMEAPFGGGVVRGQNCNLFRRTK